MTDHTGHRAAEIKAELTDRILTEGHINQFVPADVSSRLHQGVAYAYTVGRTLVERPEWLVTGLPITQAEQVLNDLVRIDDEVRHPSGQRPSAEDLAGTHQRVLVNGGAVKVKLVHADAAPLITALLTFGIDKVSVVQALWPRGDDYPGNDTLWPDQTVHPYGRTPLSREDPYS